MKWYLFDRNQWQYNMNINRTSNNMYEFAIRKFESWSICKPLYFNRIRVEISFKIWSTASQGNSLSFLTFLDCSYVRSLARRSKSKGFYLSTRSGNLRMFDTHRKYCGLTSERKKKNIKDDSLLKDKLRDIRFVLCFFITSHNPPILRNFSDSSIRTQ